MCDAFGIVNYEGSDIVVKGLQSFRPLAAFSFLGRYRLIDFPLSNLSNSGVDKMKVFVKGNPRSLIEHLGTGRHYNINSKRGSLHILPAISSVESSLYNNDVNSFLSNLQMIEEVNHPYIIIVPGHIVYRQDFSVLLKEHIDSNADITVLYQNVDNAKDQYTNCDVLKLNKQKGIESIERNRGNIKSRAVSLETYILSKDLFMDLVKKAASISSLYWFKDVINESCNQLDIRGIAHRGYVACINDFKSYYKSNMELLDREVAEEFFEDEWPIYTRTNDSCPTQYAPNTNVKGSIISNGCEIEGNIESSVVGRGCVIKRGATVKNSILLPGAYIGEDVVVENVIVDKKARITRMKSICGNYDQPMYVKRNDKI